MLDKQDDKLIVCLKDLFK